MDILGNINISKVSIESIEEVSPTELDSTAINEYKINDYQATSFIKQNEFNLTKELLPSVQLAIGKLPKENKAAIHIVCSLSGISSSLIVPSILSSSFDEKTILSHTYPLSLFYSLATKSDQELYSLTEHILAGITLALYKSKQLLRSTNTQACMDNSILATAGKFVLVEAIKLFSFIQTNNVDIDTLPKLDISYETHSNGVSNFTQPLSSFLSLVKEEALLSMESNSNKALIMQQRRLQDELNQIEKRKAKEHRLVESAYEVKRKEAVKALKEASIDLAYMNYKKLVNVLTTAITNKNGAELMSKEIKTKLLERLTEISSNSKDLILISQLTTIKAFITLAISDRVEARKDSALERASDLMNKDSVQMSAKDRLLAKLKASAKKEGV